MTALLKTSAKIRIADQNLKDCFAFAEKINTAKATELKKVRTECISVPKIAYHGNRSEQETQSEQNFIRQKYLFYNRSRFKRYLIGAITCLFLLIYPLTACAGETNPVPKEGLPWGVFPLNDVTWHYKQGTFTELYDFLMPESIYDTETGERIGTLFYNSAVINSVLSVKQITENEAELYSSATLTATRQIWDIVNQIPIWLDDTTFGLEENYLLAKILIEDKKVYYNSRILYDFSLNVGDTFYVGTTRDYDSAPYILSSVDSVLVLNEYRKRYNYITSAPVVVSQEFSVIEGLGVEHFHFTFTRTSPFIYVDPIPGNLGAIYYKDQKIWPIGTEGKFLF